MSAITIDCRSEEGVTVGLVDAIIAVARILSKRDLSPASVREALKDLASDEISLPFCVQPTRSQHHDHRRKEATTLIT